MGAAAFENRYNSPGLLLDQLRLYARRSQRIIPGVVTRWHEVKPPSIRIRERDNGR